MIEGVRKRRLLRRGTPHEPKAPAESKHGVVGVNLVLYSTGTGNFTFTFTFFAI